MRSILIYIKIYFIFNTTFIISIIPFTKKYNFDFNFNFRIMQKIRNYQMRPKEPKL